MSPATSPWLANSGSNRLAGGLAGFTGAGERPFADGTFDVDTSVAGAMFAPRPQVAARELLRVCRGAASWRWPTAHQTASSADC